MTSTPLPDKFNPADHKFQLGSYVNEAGNTIYYIFGPYSIHFRKSLSKTFKGYFNRSAGSLKNVWCFRNKDDPQKFINEVERGVILPSEIMFRSKSHNKYKVYAFIPRVGIKIGLAQDGVEGAEETYVIEEITLVGDTPYKFNAINTETKNRNTFILTIDKWKSIDHLFHEINHDVWVIK